MSATKRRKIEAEAAACKATSQTILWMVNMEACNRMLRCGCHHDTALTQHTGALHNSGSEPQASVPDALASQAVTAGLTL